MRYIILNIYAIVTLLYIATPITMSAQNFSKFTWEGAFTGNKAVWNPGDSLNTYSVNGIDITVQIIDPYLQNTTPSNPSDYGDYTESNSFYGRGNLSYQIRTQQSKLPTHLKFSFSKPVFLDSFQIWDIDMLQSTTDLKNTYVDSVHVSASNAFGDVPLTIKPLKETGKSYTISGQSIYANCIAGVNGNVLHNDSIAAVQLNSAVGIKELTISFANSGEDDGISNSQALKVTGFLFKEVLGSISGTVYNNETNSPLAGAKLLLLDPSGNAVLDKNGIPITFTTGPLGTYRFDQLHLGSYTIREINPTGYDSTSDADGSNDDLIHTVINVAQLESSENDFYDQPAKPLAVKITNFSAEMVVANVLNAKWSVDVESYTYQYILSMSYDGITYDRIAEVYANGDTKYSENVSYPYKGVTYVKLEELDLSGQLHDLGIIIIRSNLVDMHIFPNPSSDFINISGEGIEKYEIIDACGRIMKYGETNSTNYNQSIDIQDLNLGQYILNVHSANGSVAFKFLKI